MGAKQKTITALAQGLEIERGALASILYTETVDWRLKPNAEEKKDIEEMEKRIEFYKNRSIKSDILPTPTLINELKQRYEASEVIEVPLVGYVNAGTPTPAEQVDLGTVFVCKSELSGITKMSGLFALKVAGDSLQGDAIEDGDTVIVEPHPALVDGKIYIVKLNNEFLARHLHQEDGSIVLTSSNGKYARMKVEELEISGRVVLSGNWRKH